MKKEYIKPSMEIVSFTTEGIAANGRITASAPIDAHGKVQTTDQMRSIKFY